MLDCLIKLLNLPSKRVDWIRLFRCKTQIVDRSELSLKHLAQLYRRLIRFRVGGITTIAADKHIPNITSELLCVDVVEVPQLILDFSHPVLAG
jgi:hypothetical protein